MKIVKVTIKKGGVGDSMMKYPARYDAQEVDREGLGPAAVNQVGISYSGAMNRGNSESHCIIMLPNALADEYSTDPDMAMITDAQADIFMEDNRVANGIPEESVNDINRLTAITAKQGASIDLTAEDIKALDVNDRTPGIVKSRKTMSEIRTGLAK